MRQAFDVLATSSMGTFQSGRNTAQGATPTRATARRQCPACQAAAQPNDTFCAGCGAALSVVKQDAALGAPLQRGQTHAVPPAYIQSSPDPTEEVPVVVRASQAPAILPAVPGQCVALACPACGVHSLFQLNDAAAHARCWACSQPLPAAAFGAHAPDALDARAVPFAVARPQMEDVALRWLIEGKYTPVDIITAATACAAFPVYLPHYYYVGRCFGTWSAMSGYHRTEHETVMVSRTTVRDGETVTEQVPETRTVTVTDWRPSSGEFSFHFDELGCASRGPLSEDYVAKVEHVDGQDVALEDTHLEGCIVEPFTASAAEIYEERVRADVAAQASSHVNNLIPGDTHRDERWEGETTYEFQRIFLPYWIARYTYRNMVYSILIHGHTGKWLAGGRPEDETQKAQVRGLYAPVWATLLSGMAAVSLIYVLASTLMDPVTYRDNGTALLGIPAVGFIVAAIVLAVRASSQATDFRDANQTKRANSRYRLRGPFFG